MNKITKKLFRYFTAVSVVLTIVVFAGFYGIFRYYSFQHHEQELKMRAEIIKSRLETYMNSCIGTQELGAYVRVLDDISLADAYFVTRDGSSFTCPCSCSSTVVIEKEPDETVKKFAAEVFRSGQYTEKEAARRDGSAVIYVGIPVKEESETTAVVAIVDTFDIDQGSFWLSIGVLSICLLLAFLISVLLSLILAKRFMEPIRRIAYTVGELAKGNYQAKTEINDGSEIGILARETDILSEKLAHASMEEERLEQMKNEYIANISHELRTPVTVLRSSIEALYEGMVPEDEVRMYERQMMTETISLQRLINDMLELSRLENDDFLIEKEQINLLAVLGDAVRSIRLIAGERDITIHSRKPEEEWRFTGDYGRLRQMFVIVLDNAVKYSENGTNIWIEAKKKKESYYISIRDEGCGIPDEKQKNIFDKFYRSGGKETNGTGLGLAIMKNIAKRHGIEVRLFSEAGKGSKFSFIIPAKNDEKI